MKNNQLINKILILSLWMGGLFFMPIQLAAQSYQINTVVIDAGHGGKDPGCGKHKDSYEKDVALKIALALGKKIEKKYPYIDVVYTRKKDEFVSLEDRAALANKHNADLFISIHCNANNSNKACGTETYVLGNHRIKHNLEVAKRENAVVLMEDNYKEKYDGFDPNSPETHIMLSLYQNVYLKQSISFASKIENQFKVETKRKSRGVKQAGFLVLRETTMPSVLIEVGFLSNKEEREFLKSTKGQDKIATSIYRAFEGYKDDVEDRIILSWKGPKSTAQPQETSKGVVFKPTEESTVYYSVQLAVTSKPLPDNHFIRNKTKNLKTITENGKYRHVSGTFESYTKAQAYLNQLKKEGFKDAFVVAFKNEKKISLAQAKSFLKK